MNGTRYTEELINDYVEQGFWHPTLLTADLCDRCARELSGKEAVVDIKTRLTWGEVNQKIGQLARGLRDLRLREGRCNCHTECLTL